LAKNAVILLLINALALAGTALFNNYCWITLCGHEY